MNFELADITIIGPALLAGLLVLSTHVPLGQQVLKHGVVFIDLAIAQVAGLGVIIAAATNSHVRRCVNFNTIHEAI